jgi:membrane-bound serine protease (ClpP class)
MSSQHPYWILLLAIVLFILEIFIPSGGVLGVLAAIAFLAAIGAAFAVGGLELGTSFMVGTAVVIPLLLVLLIKIWPKTPFGKRILIQIPDSDDVLPALHQERLRLIGKRGVAISPLLPAGAIRIEGRTYDAISDGMSIEKGTAIEVVAIRNNAIVVRPGSMTEEPSRGAPSTTEHRGPLDVVIPDPFDDSSS